MAAKILLFIGLSTLLYILISLGFWQLDRAHEKRQIQTLANLAENAAVTNFSTQDIILEKQHRFMRFTGAYDHKKQFIYDNQIHQGQVGYYVLTPFSLNNSSATLLVNRGFIPWGLYRTISDNIAVSNVMRNIVVKIAKPIVRPQLSHFQTTALVYPHLVQTLDLEALKQLSGYNFLPVIGLLNAKQANGFVRVWQPFYGSIEKHQAYALQWFMMAVFLLILSVYFFKKSNFFSNSNR